ncbi:MAG TPA: DUF2750 domain-containing protein [Thermoanaerobaculia bacterium]|jgi:hypothetical protein|nr:DUF2750 domain-containing protein [Thermoanaerobaculia bacterium]
MAETEEDDTTEEETDEEAHSRFIAETIEGGRVCGLSTQDGFLACESDEAEGRAVLPFWSDADEARTAQPEVESSEVDSIELFDFLFRWLPGMEDDDVLVGTNWTEDLEGKEVEPLTLQDEILDAMSDDMRISYLDRLAREVRDAGDAGEDSPEPE